ncbi:FUSC family protein [Gluconacetobacter tumulisoli]|uniref:FUSC family protein n=1 Tax=Gluconacetobacter tumulisoli TaxID=1286189 RepID=A0A7W4K4E8_9PROT|nr:FUSC family protein [Gluconacetobacter tumulisoli]MBB2200012.1 FUSC family protein [Gluconacetobacter tumulisoli]
MGESARGATAGVLRWVWFPDLPQEWFPPGWFAFCMRTWASAVLALSVAFWLQIDAPASAGVTVMILAQPLRGQVLSKSLYRMGGTLVGAAVAILLVAAFGQDRIMLLGGAALWLGLCVVVGTLARDFRAYGALLAGYTVSIVGVSCIDRPEDVFTVAIFRVSAIMVGIASVAVVNDLFGSPSAWQALAAGLRRSAGKVRQIARDAVAGQGIPDNGACTALAAGIMSLTSQVSFARTELEDSALRTTGARSAMVALLDVMSCARAIGGILREGDVRASVLARVRARFGDGTPFASATEARAALVELVAHDAGEPPLTPPEAYLIERTLALLSYGRWVEDGIRTLEDGRAAPRVAHDVRIIRHQDPVLALLNGLRILMGFSAAAAICILSDLPGSTVALVQVAIVLTLSVTTFNTQAFGFGALIGVPLATACALVLNYHVLPLGSGMVFLAMVIAPIIFVTCLLLIHPKSFAIGFNFGVFFFVMLGLDNIHNYDPTQFIDRNVFYMLSAVIVFVSLVLLLPPSARRRRFRVAMAVAVSLRRQFAGRGEVAGPALISRQYDRLIQARTWTGYLPDTLAARRVFGRIVALGDLIGALARARRHLQRAITIDAVADQARQALDALTVRDVPMTVERTMRHATALLAQSNDLQPADRETVIGAVSGLFGASRLLERNARALRHYGLLPRGEAG